MRTSATALLAFLCVISVSTQAPGPPQTAKNAAARRLTILVIHGPNIGMTDGEPKPHPMR